ncbi:MAG TPA: SCO family protein [Pyrinomonadaceae bacterium]|nr:SCO family protein [Pyrinomonadaceae bacterium]
MKQIVLLIVASALFGASVVTAQTTRPSTSKPKSSQKMKVVYACPMHPDVTSTKRGKCPKCGMDLRRTKTEVADAPPESAPVDPVADPSVPKTENYSLAAKIPHARVLDQNGKQLNFYDDLIKGKSVAINFVFTTCTAICPPLTATFRRVQQEAKTRGLDVQLISISVDPTVDTPERLQDFAQKFKAEPGWTFVTGDKAEIDSLLQALGAAVVNKNDHTPMILIGNEVTDQWTRTYGLSSPKTIVDLIQASSSKK